MLNNIQNGWRPAIIKLGVISLVAFCIFFTWPATAITAEVFKLDSQWTCGKTDDLVKELKQANEEVILGGAIDNILVFTFWGNPKDRTFTAVATLVAKPETSCIIVHGDKLFILSPKNII
jgi:hypothetical protein